MQNERKAFAIFCDDIRQEVQNKTSLIGCYNREIIFEAIPTTLAKLCANVIAETPLDKPFEQLTFSAYMNGNLFGELEISANELASIAHRVDDQAPDIMTIQVAMVFSPLLVDKPGRLRVEVRTESEVLDAGYAILRTPPQIVTK